MLLLRIGNANTNWNHVAGGIIQPRMTTTPKSSKHGPQQRQECESSPSPLAGQGPGGHRPSFKSTKLARRARSFKDEFLEKISQMRSPTALGMRSQSPKGRPIKHELDMDAHQGKGPIAEFEALSKQMHFTLKHFRDVISKHILEMLPGNGTIVLDTVWQINRHINSTMGDESGASVRSATHRMHQSVAQLIKLCDDALIDCSSLEAKLAIEVVQSVEDAVQDLIDACVAKLKQQANGHKALARNSYANISVSELTGQRNSLPDIPLTPRERQILQQTSTTSGIVRSSHSTESILRDGTPPPPKPPLPPPPLPPKLKQRGAHSHTLFNSSLERMSIHSRSPEEDSSSLLSASAGSLDSVLNQSREDEEDEDEEESALMDHHVDDSDAALESDLADIEDGNGYDATNGSLHWEDAVDGAGQERIQAHNHFPYNRLSNTDSGIVSIESQSARNSSCSKRNSQQSTQWTQCKSATVTSTSMEMLRSESRHEVHKSSTTVTQNISRHKMLLHLEHADAVAGGDADNHPPALPLKTRRKAERQASPYDNVVDCVAGEVIVACQRHKSQQSLSTSTSVSSSISQDNGKPPPLPPKKKHMFQSVAYSVMAYMEMFGNCSHSSDQEFMRHSVHVHTAWTPSPTLGLPTTQSCSFTNTFTNTSSSHRATQSVQMHGVSAFHLLGDSSPMPSPMSSPHIPPTQHNASLPPALPPRKLRNNCCKSPPQTPQSTHMPEAKTSIDPLPDLLENTPKSEDGDDRTEESEVELMEKVDNSSYLLLKKPEEEGPDIRGGSIDALIIQATKNCKQGYLYPEAFLTTYRTFVPPFDLVAKLIRRYNFFYTQPDKKPRSREAFVLLVRVVNDLTVADLDAPMQQKLMDFVQQLITGGELTLAKALRAKFIEKHNANAKEQQQMRNATTSLALANRNCTLLEFKSEQIAEQMTLMDSELFLSIEIPEVLIWAQEQNEERSPNLTRFTEHFNKMSYWARTRILLAEAKDREKYFMKFIKIMKHLRKINNFNSYLALLSALDSAPVRRLEWQKHVQEGLKEYCALIDSSSSFRAYRQALAAATPPCIPYIGLVLQDLTFVHIGNSNLLGNNMINFSKRWQQYNIVENMKMFKKRDTTYTFRRNERILAFFQNFDDHISEDAMWQLSENIKPRGGKKTT